MPWERRPLTHLAPTADAFHDGVTHEHDVLSTRLAMRVPRERRRPPCATCYAGGRTSGVRWQREVHLHVVRLRSHEASEAAACVRVPFRLHRTTRSVGDRGGTRVLRGPKKCACACACACPQLAVTGIPIGGW
eukprot:scaffold37854_cov61-Phaeocystis_antarctica.AAC.4